MQRCVCFGHDSLKYSTAYRQFDVLLTEEVPEMGKVVQDYTAALINNYECNNGKPSVPNEKDLDVNNPVAYPKCFIAFRRLDEDDEFNCSIDKNKW